MEIRLQQFLIDDLKKVEHHVQELIENIYARNNDKEIGGYKKDIEEIEMFFSYWKQHSQIKTK